MKQRSESPFFTQDQRKFIAADLKEKGLSEFKSEQFIITCERTLLDPFSRQIYARPQRLKKTFPSGSEEWVTELIIITAIDGLRAVAERSGEYRGQTPVEWYGTDPDTGKLGWLPFWSGVNPQFPEAFPLLLSGIFLAEEEKDEAEVSETQREPEAQTPPAEKTIYLPTVQPPEAPQEPEEEPEAPTTHAEPEKVAGRRRTKAQAPAEEPQEPEEPAKPTAKPAGVAPKGSPEWMSYVITFITMSDYQGKQIGDLTPAQVEKLQTGWVQKYAPKIAQNPDKQREANMISAAYKHHFPG
jgi:hypothetical protein